ncbi:DUF4350 domain-containing protein [Pyrococcus woesei]|uniref:DUF4350 domain-containing protein n=1 Tax=Pyrococcus woesei TaxID=2262 RepID=UPI003D2F3D50
MRRAIYFSLIAIGIFFMISPLTVPLFTNTTPFSIFNPSPMGASSFAKVLFQGGEIYPILISFNFFELGKREGTLIILGPDLSYSSQEIEEIKEFLENGGILILIDDFGTGNEILEGLNLSVRFAKTQPIDVFYSKNYNFPVVVRINDENLENVEMIILNVPSVITWSNGSIVTSKITMLGRSFRQYSIMATLDYGKGKIVLFSDPSVFTNEMFKYNSKFIESFVEAYVEYPAYIDEAHHSGFNIVQTGTVTIRREVNKQLAFLVISTVTLIALFIESGMATKTIKLGLKLMNKILNRIFGEEKTTIDDIIEELKKEGYDERILKKIIRGIEKSRRLGESGIRGKIPSKAQKRNS